MFTFARSAAASIETRRAEGEGKWRKLVIGVVKSGNSPTYDEVRAAAPHLEDLSVDDLLAKLDADCTLASEFASEAELLTATKAMATKLRTPATVAADIAKLRTKLEELEAEFAESDRWHGGTSAISERLRTMRGNRPDLFEGK
jgi:hypothetical protein